MASQKTDDRNKKTPEKTQRKEELSERELDKVSGGMKRSRSGDPCDGGE
jgi:bacteriocin-like protein